MAYIAIDAVVPTTVRRITAGNAIRFCRSMRAGIVALALYRGDYCRPSLESIVFVPFVVIDAFK